MACSVVDPHFRDDEREKKKINVRHFTLFNNEEEIHAHHSILLKVKDDKGSLVWMCIITVVPVVTSDTLTHHLL